MAIDDPGALEGGRYIQDGRRLLRVTAVEAKDERVWVEDAHGQPQTDDNGRVLSYTHREWWLTFDEVRPFNLVGGQAQAEQAA